jgi:hypothetical protein
MRLDTRQLLIVLGLVAVTALTRLLPHPPNFVPVGAIALVAGAMLRPRWLAYLLPIAAMLLADLALGWHRQMPLVYASLAAVVWLGARLGERPGPGAVVGASLAGSTLFFVVTNLGVWAYDGLYPPTAQGLLTCYVAALPFYGNSVLADLCYAGLLFGGLRWLERPRAGVGAVPRP